VLATRAQEEKRSTVICELWLKDIYVGLYDLGSICGFWLGRTKLTL